MSFIHSSALSPFGSEGRSRSVAPPCLFWGLLPFFLSSLAFSSSKNSRTFFSNSSSSTLGSTGRMALLREDMSELSEGTPSKNSCLKFSRRFSSSSNCSACPSSSAFCFFMATAIMLPKVAAPAPPATPARTMSKPEDFCAEGCMNTVSSITMPSALMPNSPAAMALRGTITPIPRTAAKATPFAACATLPKKPFGWLRSEDIVTEVAGRCTQWALAEDR
mmetsp:Transcript_19628/g.28836  ORF Transcript_19628/g.28836 Transcript_19628/m.28836 type:complete len:220 (+) Transcript_19628:687-1346(+)